MGTHFTLGATVRAFNTAISRVQFYDNGHLLGTGVVNGTGEYLFTWQSAPAGSHVLTAIAIDIYGNKVTSAAVQITVT
jgi:hypothetical protein